MFMISNKLKEYFSDEFILLPFLRKINISIDLTISELIFKNFKWIAKEYNKVYINNKNKNLDKELNNKLKV